MPEEESSERLDPLPGKERSPAEPSSCKPVRHRIDSFARAANEDDDGYDPWSDRPAHDKLWEEDPWR